MLDALREGEPGVRMGLAEKVNFEVALLKAVEASRARAIDTLIKELAAIAAGEPASAGGPSEASAEDGPAEDRRAAEKKKA
jgi:DNA polymerase-3 subunit gamma/tau